MRLSTTRTSVNVAIDIPRIMADLPASSFLSVSAVKPAPLFKYSGLGSANLREDLRDGGEGGSRTRDLGVMNPSL